MTNLNLISGVLNNFSNLPEGTEIFPLSNLATSASGGVVYVLKNDVELDKIKILFEFFFKNIDILTFPAWDTNPYDKTSPSSQITSTRLKTLAKLSLGLGKNQILLTTINAISQKIIPHSIISGSNLYLAVGQNINRNKLTEFLVNNSYRNISAATDYGEFSIRGSIIDIVPPASEYGIRLDFFGDELESIRTYDPLTQVSQGKIDSFDLTQASEIILNEKTLDSFKENFLSEFGIKKSSSDYIYESIMSGIKPSGAENYLPLFYQLETIFDYCKDAIFAFPTEFDGLVDERFKAITESYNFRFEYDGHSDFEKSTYLPPSSLYLSLEETKKRLENKKQVSISRFKIGEYSKFEFNYLAGKKYSALAASANQSVYEIIKQEAADNFLANRGKPKQAIIIACMGHGSRQRMQNIFAQNEINTFIIDDFQKEKSNIPKAHFALTVLPVEDGFETDEIKLITEAEILGEKIYRRAKASGNKKAENFIKEAASLSANQLVVHKENGIGRFLGLETLNVQGIVHDFILLEYRDGDKFYVPVENIDLISRFGNEDESAELDKLGAASWQERTARVKKRINEIAGELIAVAAKRLLRKGQIYDYPEGAYEEFCKEFPFAETDDQLSSINDVLTDITSGRPMDRLICGDVGFGKTEVALRAAFVSALSGSDEKPNQIAIICPTTLLCRQHFETFTKRFRKTPYKVVQLSRLVGTAQTRKNKEAITSGTAHIVIGTHSLLASNIEFKNLSMVIIDEEQRFGVAQKEKLKKLKNNTHVLTLSATPIPRTLQLSLSGIRDLSLITTPPIDRLAVRTFIMPFDHVSVREALMKEYMRGGKSYFVVPRIKDLEDLEPILKALVPELKIVAAHGQMKPEILDQIMTDFYEGKFNVLLATTIVESGLDVPSANTIIIHKAEMFGLAQLYQLRGRVGRGKTRAYAYLTYPARKQLTKNAEARLQVMQKLDTLGAGFTLASYDMDIRGFGNLLGDEQSGNIREVGVELYQAMLSDAIAKLKAEKQNYDDEDHTFSVKINLGASVLIPETYVADGDLRMGLYRRLGNLSEEAEVESFAAEMVDRFGTIPPEVENLFNTIKIKIICRALGVEKIDAGEKGATLTFRNNKFHNPDALINLIASNPAKFKIKDNSKLSIANRDWKNLTTKITELTAILSHIKNVSTPTPAV